MPTTRASATTTCCAVIAEKGLPPDNQANTDGNRHFYGFECENPGDGEDPWPEVQPDAIERSGRGRVPAPRLDTAVGHRPPGVAAGQGGRRGFPMAWLRERVGERLKSPGGPAPGHNGV